VISRRRLPRHCLRTAYSEKHDRGWGRPRMRYPASEKLEIIRLIDGSPLPVKRTLAQVVCRGRHFTDGTIFTNGSANLVSKTAGPGRNAHRGTAFPMTCDRMRPSACAHRCQKQSREPPIKWPSRRGLYTFKQRLAGWRSALNCVVRELSHCDVSLICVLQLMIAAIQRRSTSWALSRD